MDERAGRSDDASKGVFVETSELLLGRLRRRGLADPFFGPFDGDFDRRAGNGN